MDGWSGVAAPLKLALVEVLDRDGHVRASVPVWRWPVTIGRGIDCDVVLDDAHVAARHAVVEDVDGVLQLRASETINGVQLGRRRLAAQERGVLAAGETFQIGTTRLRVRRTSDALAPEQLLGPDPHVSRRSILILLLVFTAWNVSGHWLDSDPGGRFTDYVAPLVGSPVIVLASASFWALGSKLFRHRFEFFPHARVALIYFLSFGGAAIVLPVAAFASEWPSLSRVSGLAESALIVAMVVAHLTLIVPSRRRMLAAVMSSLFVVGALLYVVRNQQTRDRPFEELYVTALPPPAFRLAPTVPMERFIEEARRLEAVLEAHVDDEENAHPNRRRLTANSRDGVPVTVLAIR